MYIIIATFCVYAMYAYITSRKYTYKDHLKKKKGKRQLTKPKILFMSLSNVYKHIKIHFKKKKIQTKLVNLKKKGGGGREGKSLNQKLCS